jgi:hypothetical protein
MHLASVGLSSTKTDAVTVIPPPRGAARGL